MNGLRIVVTWGIKIIFFLAVVFITLGVLYSSYSKWWMIGFGILGITNLSATFQYRMPWKAIFPYSIVIIAYMLIGTFTYDGSSVWLPISGLIIELFFGGGIANLVDEAKKKKESSASTPGETKQTDSSEHNQVQPAASEPETIAANIPPPKQRAVEKRSAADIESKRGKNATPKQKNISLQENCSGNSHDMAADGEKKNKELKTAPPAETKVPEPDKKPKNYYCSFLDLKAEEEKFLLQLRHCENDTEKVELIYANWCSWASHGIIPPTIPDLFSFSEQLRSQIIEKITQMHASEKVLTRSSIFGGLHFDGTYSALMLCWTFPLSRIHKEAIDEMAQLLAETLIKKNTIGKRFVQKIMACMDEDPAYLKQVLSRAAEYAEQKDKINPVKHAVGIEHMRNKNQERLKMFAGAIQNFTLPQILSNLSEEESEHFLEMRDILVDDFKCLDDISAQSLLPVMSWQLSKHLCNVAGIQEAMYVGTQLGCAILNGSTFCESLVRQTEKDHYLYGMWDVAMCETVSSIVKSHTCNNVVDERVFDSYLPLLQASYDCFTGAVNNDMYRLKRENPSEWARLNECAKRIGKFSDDVNSGDAGSVEFFNFVEDQAEKYPTAESTLFLIIVYRHNKKYAQQGKWIGVATKVSREASIFFANLKRNSKSNSCLISDADRAMCSTIIENADRAIAENKR